MSRTLYSRQNHSILTLEVSACVNLNWVLLRVLFRNAYFEVASTAIATCERNGHRLIFYRVVEQVEVHYAQLTIEVWVLEVDIAFLVFVCLVVVVVIVGKLREHINAKTSHLCILYRRLDVLNGKDVFFRSSFYIRVIELPTIAFLACSIIESFVARRLPIFVRHKILRGLDVAVLSLRD